MTGEYYIKNGEYDPNTGVSTVTIVTKYGEFTGTAKMHEEDAVNESRFFGCRIAEKRALLKYSKAVFKEKTAQTKILRHLQKTVENSKPKDYKTIKIINNLYFNTDKEAILWKHKINLLKSSIKEDIETRDKTIQKFKEWSK